MNKNCILIICLSFLVVFAAYSQQYDDENDFIYENIWDHHDRGSIMRPELMITGYVGGKSYVSIPPLIQGLPVKRINSKAFREKGLTRITIPEGITSIGDSAFENNQLTRVVIPSSIGYIGHRAFKNNQLTYVEFLNDGRGLEYIGYGAFMENKISSIILPYGLTYLVGGIFDYNNLTSIIIPNNITSIGIGAFINNNQIAIITIGENVYLPYLDEHDGFGHYCNPPRYPAFDNNFDQFYVRNGRKGGTYIYSNGQWVLQN